MIITMNDTVAHTTEDRQLLYDALFVYMNECQKGIENSPNHPAIDIWKKNIGLCEKYIMKIQEKQIDILH